MSRRKRPDKRKERREPRGNSFGPFAPAPEWSHVPRPHLEHTCRTLDHLVGLRNIVISDLHDHLSDDHKAMLGWPLNRLNPEVAARVRVRLPRLA